MNLYQELMSFPEIRLFFKNAKAMTKWEMFLKYNYEGGKKKVPNTNKDTKDKFPMVSFSTLFSSDPLFNDKVKEEYDAWLKSNPDLKLEEKEDSKSQESNTNLKRELNTKEGLDKHKNQMKTHITDSLKQDKSLSKILSKWKEVDKKNPEDVSVFFRDHAPDLSKMYVSYRNLHFSPEHNKMYDKSIKDWVDSSNTMKSWQLHNMASKLEFSGTKFFGLDSFKAKEEGWDKNLNPDIEEAFMGAYLFQQSIFEELGISEVTIYRGSYTNNTVGQKVKIESRPCASTTNSKEIASRFGNTLCSYTVPIKNILTSPFLSRALGKKGSGEDEYVVMGLTDIVATVESKHKGSK